MLLQFQCGLMKHQLMEHKILQFLDIQHQEMNGVLHMRLGQMLLIGILELVVLMVVFQETILLMMISIHYYILYLMEVQIKLFILME
jgi:hypothetical protein